MFGSGRSNGDAMSVIGEDLRSILTRISDLEARFASFEGGRRRFHDDDSRAPFAFGLVRVCSAVEAIRSRDRGYYMDMMSDEVQPLMRLSEAIESGYADVDPDDIWDAIERDVPRLRALCERLLERETASSRPRRGLFSRG